MTIFRTAVSVLTLCITASVALADIGRGATSDALLYSGPIQQGDQADLAAALEVGPETTLELNSAGGDWQAALDMADTVASLGLATRVANGGVCEGPCLLPFLAGSARSVQGWLGNGFGWMTLSQARVFDLLESQGERREVIFHMMNPANTGYMSANDLDYLGLQRTGYEAEAARVAGQERAAVAFRNYGATPLASAPQMPDFSGRDAWAADYRTRLTEGAQQGPNFAGVLRVVEIGCGAGCRFVYMIDLRDGTVIEVPYGGEAYPGLTMLYANDSGLLRVSWSPDPATCMVNEVVINDYGIDTVRDFAGNPDHFCN